MMSCVSRFTNLEKGWKSHYSTDSRFISRVCFLDQNCSLESDSINYWQEKIMAQFDLAQGPLFGAVFFLKRNKLVKILLIAHHLIIDGVSWRIFLEDFEALYRAWIQNRNPALPSRTSSYKNWAKELYNNVDIISSESSAWLLGNDIVKLPRDFESPTNLEEESNEYTIRLNTDFTQKFLQMDKSCINGSHEEILLTILAQIVEKWTNHPCLFVDLESHGRHELTSQLDWSRTVGWFTSLFPFHVTWPENAPLKLLLEKVKKQRQAIKDNEVNYGTLRYLGTDTTLRQTLQDQPQAEISFNYWGQFKQNKTKSSVFQLTNIYLKSGQKKSPRLCNRYQFVDYLR